MKNFYHVCLTAHDEVLIRNEEDARWLINLSALAAHRTDSEILTDAVLSTHLHLNTICKSPDEFIHRVLESETKYFNGKYSRHGRLFDRNPFSIRLDGPRRIQMSLCYGLRQGMHHGITQTPFEYQWSSCNSLFRKERGLKEEIGRNDLKYILPKNAEYPEDWIADKNGILIRSCFENTKLVETWFGTARSFMTSMNRKTSEEWIQEQDADNVNQPRITLNLIESGFKADEIQQMLSNEGNAKYSKANVSDMEICKIIDNNLLGQFHAVSVYQLDITQKMKIMDELRFEHKLRNIKQLSRCLALKY